MASLTGQSIASSYEQLLSLPDGGGNGSSLVAITDGDGATTFCVSITDASTGKAILAVDGSHANGTEIQIDNSATDGDVFLSFQLSGTSKFTMGVDDGDSDKFKIGTTAIGTGTMFALDVNSRISLSNNDGGATSGEDSTTGNTIFGYLAGSAVDSDTINNVLIGHKAGTALNAGDENVLIGASSGDALTTGDSNTAIGRGSIGASVAGTRMVAIGQGAIGGANTTALAIGSVSVGMDSLYSLTSGAGNVAVGYQTLSAEDAGGRSTAVGYQALSAQNNNTGSNTAVGWSSGDSIVAGYANTLLGSESGTTGTNDLTSGYQNTLIGQATAVSAAGAINQTVIGRGAAGTGNNEIALGNTSVSAIKAQVTSITAYSSDERTKKDVKDYNINGLDFIKELQLKTYIYKNPADYPDEIKNPMYNNPDLKPDDPTETQVGFIAQEVEEALKKHSISNVETYAPTQESGIKTLTYGNLIFPLIKAVQELSAKVTELENK